MNRDLKWAACVVERSGGILDDDIGLCPVIGHGDESNTGLPALAQGGRDVTECESGLHGLRSNEVRRDVLVTESEPCGLDSVFGQFLLDREGLAFSAPSALNADAPAEGVHDGVEVGADAQAVNPNVVAGIPDDGDVVVGPCCEDPFEKACSTDAAGQCRDPHRPHPCTGRWVARGRG